MTRIGLIAGAAAAALMVSSFGGPMDYSPNPHWPEEPKGRRRGRWGKGYCSPDPSEEPAQGAKFRKRKAAGKRMWRP